MNICIEMVSVLGFLHVYVFKSALRPAWGLNSRPWDQKLNVLWTEPATCLRIHLGFDHCSPLQPAKWGWNRSHTCSSHRVTLGERGARRWPLTGTGLRGRISTTTSSSSSLKLEGETERGRSLRRKSCCVPLQSLVWQWNCPFPPALMQNL